MCQVEEVVLSGRVVRAGLSERAKFEQRLKGGEKRMCIWGGTSARHRIETLMCSLGTEGRQGMGPVFGGGGRK